MSSYGAAYIQDMKFLRRAVWPRVQSVAYCHDSFTCHNYPASHPFPVVRQGTEHLGEVFDQFSVGRRIDINILRNARVNINCVSSSSQISAKYLLQQPQPSINPSKTSRNRNSQFSHHLTSTTTTTNRPTVKMTS